MAVWWIDLSTQWKLADVQTALNVVISILGALGLWVISRHWWQRGYVKDIAKEYTQPSLQVTLSNGGRPWILVVLLWSKVFQRGNFTLLAQVLSICIVIGITIMAGPISKASLRPGSVMRQAKIQGLAAVKGSTSFGNKQNANVAWNTTIQSLEAANFPLDILMDFVPPNTQPCSYQESEWNPTWRATCSDTEETPLTIVANSDAVMFDPIAAFPAFGDTLDPQLLNRTAFRYSVDFCGWKLEKSIKDVVMYVLIQSEPRENDQMNKNQSLLFISLSTIRLHGAALLEQDAGFGERATWRINGTVGNASYVRTECTFARKAQVANEAMIPWPWTNDTDAIAKGFADYARYGVARASSNDQPLSPFSPRELR